MNISNIYSNENPISVLDRFLDLGIKGLTEYPAQESKCDLYNSNFGVQEEEEQYVATLDLPGVKKKDIDLKVEGKSLSIKAKRNTRGKENSEEQSIQHSLTLGDGVNTENIHATLEDGVLEIILPKAEANKSRQIAVH